MEKKTERRSITGAQIRAAANEDFVLVGRALTYGVQSELNVPAPGAREKVAPGAFKDSLQRGDTVAALLNHDVNFCLGKTGGAGLTLSDSGTGLNFAVRLRPDVSYMRDVYNLAKTGNGSAPIIDSCSFGFICEDDDVVMEQDARGLQTAVRVVKKARLLDISVLSGAPPAYGNGATEVDARAVAYRFLNAEPSVDELRAKAAAMGEDFKRQERAHEIGIALLRDLNLADDSEDDEDEDDRSITDFLASRFGPSRFGHAARYVPMSNDGANASTLPADVVCLDFNTGTRVKFRVYRDDDGNLDCDEPNFYSEGA